MIWMVAVALLFAVVVVVHAWVACRRNRAVARKFNSALDAAVSPW